MHARRRRVVLRIDCVSSDAVCAGSWDLSQEGLVFGLAVGPYGTLMALCWDRGSQMGGASKLVLLHSNPSAPLLLQLMQLASGWLVCDGVVGHRDKHIRALRSAGSVLAIRLAAGLCILHPEQCLQTKGLRRAGSWKAWSLRTTWRLWRRQCGWQAPIGPWQSLSQRPACHTAGCTSSSSCRQVHACLMQSWQRSIVMQWI